MRIYVPATKSTWNLKISVVCIKISFISAMNCNNFSLYVILILFKFLVLSIFTCIWSLVSSFLLWRSNKFFPALPLVQSMSALFPELWYKFPWTKFLGFNLLLTEHWNNIFNSVRILGIGIMLMLGGTDIYRNIDISIINYIIYKNILLYLWKR